MDFQLRELLKEASTGDPWAFKKAVNWIKRTLDSPFSLPDKLLEMWSRNEVGNLDVLVDIFFQSFREERDGRASPIIVWELYELINLIDDLVTGNLFPELDDRILLVLGSGEGSKHHSAEYLHNLRSEIDMMRGSILRWLEANDPSSFE